MLSCNKAIGGYSELELPIFKSALYPQALGFQSARAAFFALLCLGKPDRVWIPHYICDSMLAPLKEAGIEFSFYSINEQFDIVDELDMRDSDWLLYVNYFGICGGNVDRILAKFNPHQVVLDHSQAFYAPPRECLATIYSPRKFFGIPDGGLLVTKCPVSVPSKIDDGSLSRSSHLLKRLTSSPEFGYADYLKAEQSLCDFEPRQMSYLTRSILESVNFEEARIRRNNNFSLCHEALGHINQLPIDLLNIEQTLPLLQPWHHQHI